MKLYYIGGVWQLPGQQDKKAMRVDISTSPADFCAFLNDRKVSRLPVDEAEDIPEADEAFWEKAVLRGPPGAPKGPEGPDGPPGVSIGESLARASWTATEIEDFILNSADVNQVANIFAKLGTRFAEIVRAETPLTGLLD